MRKNMPKRYLKYKYFSLIIGCFVILLCCEAAAAQSIPQVENKRAEINEKIKFYSESYGDVPPSYSCNKPKFTYDKVICANKDLQLVEKLYRMASVYAYENATKIETNHKTFKNWYRGISSRNKLKTRQAVLNYFIENIYHALAGESPFYDGK